MTWDAIGALGSILGVFVLAAASVAAFVQLKHLRLANQLASYALYTEQLQSAEITEARAFLESLDLSAQDVVESVITPHVDHRIVTIGAHFQAVCRLLNLGILDERVFIAYVSVAPQVWEKLKPIAYALREREGAPRWIDIEYLIYRSSKRRSLVAAKGDYDAVFLSATGLGEALERNQARIDRL
jgi:hypothetical protein